MDYSKYKSKLPWVSCVKDMAAWKARRDDEKHLVELFFADTLEELNLPDNPITRKLLGYAWEEGHSYGFYEVFNHMDDYSALYECIKENKELL